MTTYWWCRPSLVALLAILPAVSLAFLASDNFYQYFGGFNAITDDRFFLAWLSVLAFAAASWCGETLITRSPAMDYPLLREPNFRWLLYGTAIVAIVATCLVLAPILAHPGLLQRIVEDDPGATSSARAIAFSVTGITSQGNLLPFLVVILMAKERLTGSRKTRTEMALLGLVLLLSTLKVVLYSERVALIDVLIPVFLLAAAVRRRSMKWTFAPLLGVAALVCFFSVTEYFRTWTVYGSASEGLLAYGWNLLVGYYAAAINNGAYIYSEGHSYFFPIFTAPWLWHLPIPGLHAYLTSLTGARTDFRDLLSGLNVELNNPSGIYAPLIDFGPVLGILVWLALGFLSGRLYRRFREGHYAGIILFPTWFIGVLEMPRVFYWGDGIYFPSLAASLSLAFALLYLLPRPIRERRVSGRSFRQPFSTTRLP